MAEHPIGVWEVEGSISADHVFGDHVLPKTLKILLYAPLLVLSIKGMEKRLTGS